MKTTLISLIALAMISCGTTTEKNETEKSEEVEKSEKVEVTNCYGDNMAQMTMTKSKVEYTADFNGGHTFAMILPNKSVFVALSDKAIPEKAEYAIFSNLDQKAITLKIDASIFEKLPYTVDFEEANSKIQLFYSEKDMDTYVSFLSKSSKIVDGEKVTTTKIPEGTMEIDKLDAHQICLKADFIDIYGQKVKFNLSAPIDKGSENL